MDCIHVIDDFYENVEDIIQLSKSLEYRSDSGGGHFSRSVGLPCRVVGEEFERILGITVDWNDTSWTSYNDFTNFNGSFYKPHMDWLPTHVHHDWYQWGGIVNLTRDLSPEWGTQFWRYVPTNSYHTSNIEGDGHDDKCDNEPENFEKTDFISYKFNRLVLFRGSMYHSAVISDEALGGLERLNQFWQFRKEGYANF